MRARLRYAAITVLIASVPLVLMLLATRGPVEPGRTPEPAWLVLGYGAAEWYPWALLAPFIDRRVRRSRPRTGADRARVFAGHAALCALFVVIHGTAMHEL